MFAKTQASGTGLTLVSAFASTLGIELPYWARLCGVIIGAVMLFWPILRYGWNEFRAAIPALKLFLVCCAIPAIGIWGMAWWITPAKIEKPIAAPAPPAATPPPAAMPTPAAKPPPWVSDEEIGQAKKAGKLLIPFSPEEVSQMNYFRGPDGTKAYVGKWVKLHNKFANVEPFVETDKKEYLVVQIQELRLTILVFDSKKWANRILTLRPGAMMDGFCQLAEYNGKAYETTSIKFGGTNCELN